jgi:DNA-binding response OmpR family regulator
MTGLLENLDAHRLHQCGGDYDSAVRLLNEQTPDFLLLDINLPGKKWNGNTEIDKEITN